MPKITAYVPDELWRKTQEFSAEINVSQLLQNALKSELRRCRRRQEVTDLEKELDVPDLRKKFSAERQQIYEAGYRMGIRFVRERAEFADLMFCDSVGWDESKVISGLLKPGDPWDEELFVAYQEFGGIPFTHFGAAPEIRAGFVDALRRAFELVADPDGPWTWTRG